VARLLRVDQRTVRAWAKEHRLTTTKNNQGHYEFSVAEITAWLEAQTTERRD